MTDESEAKSSLQEWAEKEYNSPTFNHGIEVGESLGSYKTSSEAIAAFEAGEIELWINLHRPKTMEEWDAFKAEHGDLKDRWKTA